MGFVRFHAPDPFFRSGEGMPRRSFWLLSCAFLALAGFALARTAAFVGRPFPGFLIYPNGMVSLFGSDDWPGVAAGLDGWDVVTAVDGHPVTTAREVLGIVRAAPAGTVFRYRIRRGAGAFDV